MNFYSFLMGTLKNNIEKINGAIHHLMFAPKSIYPLITFRILFGALMCFGTARFMYYGWVDKLFIEPNHFFKYYGFEWIEPLSASGMYFIHLVILISTFFISIGFLYRISSITFLLSFTYVELIDATNYLNHYYLVILLALILCFVSANASASIDAKIFPRIKKEYVPAWSIHLIIFQLCIVYFYAGIAKLNHDWLFRAMPLSIWLPEHRNIPILGYFFQIPFAAYLFSWFGAIYDLTIWVFLLNKKSRPIAYFLVLAFHLMTMMLFNIGLFPLIMIFSTLIFFSSDWHRKFYGKTANEIESLVNFKSNNLTLGLLSAYIIFQLLFPLRSHLYSGNVLWHEQGYRFSWRVMVVEKSGTAMFFIEDKDTGNRAEINHAKYLTDFQKKQMTIQPDFILQYARIIANDYKKRFQIDNPKITADIFVALNKRTSSRLIDPNVDLLEIEDSFSEKEWVFPLKEE